MDMCGYMKEQAEPPLGYPCSELAIQRRAPPVSGGDVWCAREVQMPMNRSMVARTRITCGVVGKRRLNDPDLRIMARGKGEFVQPCVVIPERFVAKLLHDQGINLQRISKCYDMSACPLTWHAEVLTPEQDLVYNWYFQFMNRMSLAPASDDDIDEIMAIIRERRMP